MKQSIPTFVKWAGGKRQLIRQLGEYFPSQIDRYFEPFVGGGAIAFYVIRKYCPREVHLSDSNEELINAYQVVQTRVGKLIELLIEYEQGHSINTYYEVRDESTLSLSHIKRAARFIYLNRTCFNGLYRVNSRGKFNVPIGRYPNPKICQKATLEEASELLQGVEIYKKSFEWVLDEAEAGDFIYFDPPYHPLSKTSKFTQYTTGNFPEPKQERLAEVFIELDRSKCKIMLSNSCTPFIIELYSDYRNTIHTVQARRSINCNAKGRNPIDELVITNYPPPHLKVD